MQNDELTIEEMIAIDAGIDDIPVDVYSADEIEFGGSLVNPNRVLHNNTPVLNQSLKNNPITTNACGAFGMTKCVNEINRIEGSYSSVICDPVKFRDLTVKLYGGSIGGGSSMTGNLKNARDNSRIAGYYKCDTIEDVKTAIARGHLIYSGTRYAKRIETVNNKTNYVVRSEKSTSGHLFFIGGYDDAEQCLLAVNSRWPNRHDNGVFKIKYSDKDKLYTTIAIVDKKNNNVIDQVTADRKHLSDAYNNSIRNGKNSEGDIIRYELALMVGRHKYGIDKDEVTLQKTIAGGLWTGDNSYGKVLRYEAVLMIMRTVFGKDADNLLLDRAKDIGIRSGNNPYIKATRWQVVIMLMRALSV